MPDILLDTVSNLLASREGTILFVISLIPVIMTVAKTITTFTPTQVDDKWLGKITPYVNGALRLLNTIALNIGKAKNADDVGKNSK